jgi:hypothetical protein
MTGPLDKTGSPNGWEFLPASLLHLRWRYSVWESGTQFSLELFQASSFSFWDFVTMTLSSKQFISFQFIKSKISLKRPSSYLTQIHHPFPSKKTWRTIFRVRLLGLYVKQRLKWMIPTSMMRISQHPRNRQP